MDLSSIGKHIREKRIENEWTQEELASKTGLSLSYVGMIERGKRIPTMETFICIINILNVSADEILENVTETGFQIRMSSYVDRMDGLTEENRNMLLDIIDVMLKYK